MTSLSDLYRLGVMQKPQDEDQQMIPVQDRRDLGAFDLIECIKHLEMIGCEGIETEIQQAAIRLQHLIRRYPYEIYNAQSN